MKNDHYVSDIFKYMYIYYMGRALQKRLWAYTDSEGPDQPAHPEVFGGMDYYSCNTTGQLT